VSAGTIKSMRLSSAVLASALALALTAALACNRSPEALKARHLERGDQYFNSNKPREAIIEYRNVLQIQPSNAKALKNIGLAHFELKEFAQAFAFLSRAEEVAPDDIDVRLKLASMYLAGRELDKARKESSFVLEKQPKNFEALLLYAGTAKTAEEIDEALKRLESLRGELDGRARFHLAVAALQIRKGDTKSGEREMKEAIAREPSSADARTALGTYYLAARQFDRAGEEFRKADELSPVNSQTRINLIDFYIATGKSAEARELLAETTKNAPDFLPAWHRSAEVALNEKRSADARIAIDTVLKKNPEDLTGRVLLARLYLADRKTTEAKQELQRVIRSEPKYAQAHYQLALVHLAESNSAQARSELGEAVAADPDFTDAKLLLAQLNLQAKAYQAAIAQLEELVAKHPEKAQYTFLLGSAYLGRKDPEKALESLRRYQQMAPKDPQGTLLAGMALRALGRNAEAQKEFEAALILDPGYVQALQQIIAPQVSKGDWEAAIRRVEEQAAKAPKSGRLQHLLGGLQFRKGDNRKAEEALLKAIELEPSFADPYIALATLYGSTNRFDEALAKLENLTKSQSKNPSAYMLIGAVQQVRGNVSAAKASYERALELNPRFGAAANNLAYILAEEGGSEDRALQLAQTAKEELPEDPRVSDTLGWVLYKRGVYERALRLINEAAEKLSEDPEIQYHLGMTHYRLGNRTEAKVALARAVGLKHDFAGADEARRILKEPG
jgi:tetratricopeptide (TPR) repeat protein